MIYSTKQDIVLQICFPQSMISVSISRAFTWISIMFFYIKEFDGVYFLLHWWVLRSSNCEWPCLRGFHCKGKSAISVLVFNLQNRAYKLNQKVSALIYLEFIAYMLMKGQEESKHIFQNKEKCDIDRYSLLFRLCLWIVSHHLNKETCIIFFIYVAACMNSEPTWKTGWLKTLPQTTWIKENIILVDLCFCWRAQAYINTKLHDEQPPILKKMHAWWQGLMEMPTM